MVKLQYFGHLMLRTDSLEKTPRLEKTEGRGEGADRGWDGWMASDKENLKSPNLEITYSKISDLNAEKLEINNTKKEIELLGK